jgi:hypothetical protein
MTSILDPLPLSECDDPAAVLAYARVRKQTEDDAARDVMIAAAQWAAMHSTASLVGPAGGWHETSLPLGGEGCPEVAEFAVTEFAAAMGKSTESGRRYLARAVEGCYRLPSCWARLRAGQLEAWRLGFIADRTSCLSPEAAAFVDRHVAAVAHKIGAAQLDRLIEEAKARFDPEQTETDRQAAAGACHLDINMAQADVTGMVHINGELDLADALDLEAVVAAGAEQQRLLGSTDSLDVRRAHALGELARGQAVLGLDAETHQRPRHCVRRRVVLHVHVEHAAVLGAGGLARLQEGYGPVTAAQVRDWCGSPDTQVTVQPVLDLAEHIHVDSYEASTRLKSQVDLRDVVCVFPFCTRRAHRCDHDHRVDHRDGGPTCSCNIAPTCRGHHRAKTTGGWSYITVDPGVYLWCSPLGYRFLRDATGTLDVTPDPERQGLVRSFVAHFGRTQAEP